MLEVQLDAREDDWELSRGQRVRAMTYNGTVPGPTIEGRVGDTLVVNFTNHLREPTTIHWHGLRVPAAMDGSEAVQTAVPPGGRFRYQFQLTDAGTFWYHPHTDEPVQMERGLYGAIVVRGNSEPTVDHEQTLVLDDVRLDTTGQIAPPGGLLEQHSGREGNTRLVNGRSDLTLRMRAGELQRWHVINAASARYFRLALPGHSFVVLGTDGGFLPQSYRTAEVLLTPGDRVDLLVEATGAPSSTVALQTLPYDRGHGAGTTEIEDVLRVQYTAEPPLPRRTLPQIVNPIARIDTQNAVHRTITLDEVDDVAHQRMVFRINGEAHPNVTPVIARIGETQVWEIVNASGMDHPFHLHGFFFQVLDRNGEPESRVSWEDTVNIPGNARVRIAFRPEGRPGMWMFHCHILEHVANGMMGHLQVIAADAVEPPQRSPAPASPVQAAPHQHTHVHG